MILAYEPTQGVDVGSRFDIYKALRARTDDGAALLVKSSDPIELSGLCDRVLVMSRGTIIEEIPGDELDEVRIVEAIVRGPGMSKAGALPAWCGDAESASDRDTARGRMTVAIETTRRRRSAAVQSAGSSRNARDKNKWRKIVKVRLWMPVVLQILLIVALFGYTNSGSTASSTQPTSRTVMMLAMPLALATIAQTHALLVGYLDLSVGAMISLGVVIASFLIGADASTFDIFTGIARRAARWVGTRRASTPG